MISVKQEEFAGTQLYQSLLGKLQKAKDAYREQNIRSSILEYRNLISELVGELRLHTSNYDAKKTKRLLDILEQYDAKYKGLLDTIDKAFMLFVVGTGKYGKSTLINSLLESDTAEVDFLPKTWKIDIFTKDVPKGMSIIHFNNGSKKTVSSIEAKKIIKQEEDKRKKSERIVRNKLNEFKKTNPDKETFDEMKLKLEREDVYISNIVEVHWGMENSDIIKKFNIVDTPGLTQKIMGEVRNSVQEFYHKADGVIWMLDATSISAANSKRLVEELEDSLSRVGGNQKDNIIAVLNRIDLIYNLQGEIGVEKVLSDAEKIYKGYFKAIVPFSAVQAFDGAVKKDTLMMQRSGLNKLHELIEDNFLANAKNIQINKKLESCYAYNQEVGVVFSKFLDELAQGLETLSGNTEKIKRLFGRDEKLINKNTSDTLEKYKSRVENNIRMSIDTLMEIKNEDYQKEYLNKQVFELDSIQAKLSKIHLKGQHTITEKTNHLLKTMYFTEYPNLDQKVFVESQGKLDLSINFSRDHTDEAIITYGSGIAAGLAAAFFLGPIGLLVGGVVGWFAKKKVKDNLSNKLTDGLNQMHQNVTKEFNEKLGDLVLKSETAVITNMYNSFNEVFGLTEVELNKGELFLEKINTPATIDMPVKDIIKRG